MIFDVDKGLLGNSLSELHFLMNEYYNCFSVKTPNIIKGQLVIKDLQALVKLVYQHDYYLKSIGKENDYTILTVSNGDKIYIEFLNKNFIQFDVIFQSNKHFKFSVIYSKREGLYSINCDYVKEDM